MKPLDDPRRETSNQPAIDLWQRRLLPFMVVTVACMAVFFFVASLWQLESFRNESKSKLLDLSADLATAPSAEEREYAQWRVLVQLEAHVITRRYEQVRALMLMRAWTRYVGFLTGMILALVGSVFVLGKLGSGESNTSQLQAEGAGFKGSLTTPLPGVVLATLGTVLMAMTILVPFEFDTRDTPAYLRMAPETLPPPRAWPESKHAEPEQPLNDDEALLFGSPSTPPRDTGPAPKGPSTSRATAPGSAPEISEERQ